MFHLTDGSRSPLSLFLVEQDLYFDSGLGSYPRSSYINFKHSYSCHHLSMDFYNKHNEYGLQ